MTSCFPQTSVSAPAYYASWYDPDTARFLLLQEAIDADNSVDQVSGISIDQAVLVVVEVAKLHARWWRDPALSQLDWLPRVDSHQRLANLTTLGAHRLAVALRIAR